MEQLESRAGCVHHADGVAEVSLVETEYSSMIWTK